MKKKLSKIYFVHDGRAAYPEIAAYQSFFANSFATEEISREEMERRNDLDASLCWHMMGFYPRRAPAGLVVHDYRSLSVGKTRKVKDWVKKLGNAKPDIRIFQNEAMARALGFADGVETLFLPMGVPEEIVSFRASREPEKAACDFAYIGVMSRERRTDLMLESFLERFGDRKRFFLYGEPEPALRRRYQGHPNLVFKGKLPQKELFAELRAARVAVNYFPDHNPHRLQTPTKLLEYAALGLRILCNEQRQSRETAKRYGIACLWGDSRDMFKNAPDEPAWEANESLDPAPFFWPRVIAASGIAERIAEGTHA